MPNFDYEVYDKNGSRRARTTNYRNKNTCRNDDGMRALERLEKQQPQYKPYRLEIVEH